MHALLSQREALSTRILTRHCSHYVSPSQTPQVMGEVRRFLEGLIVRGLVVRGFILGGLILRGLFVRCLDLRGWNLRGLLVRGLAVRGWVLRGLVVRSLIVNERFGGFTRPWENRAE